MPPNFHYHNQLPLDLDQPDSQSQEEGQQFLSSHRNKNSGSSTLKSEQRLSILWNIAGWIVKVLIILGQISLWIFERLMHTFRNSERNRIIFFVHTIFSQFALRYDIFQKGIISGTYSKAVAIATFLYILSPMYHWIIGRKYSGARSDNTNDKSNEGMDELNEKNTLLKYFLERIREMGNRQENLPQGLTIAIQLTLADVRRLTSELNVASELSSGNGSGLIEAEISNIPKEKYSVYEIDDGSDMCSICIGNFQHKEEVRKLPCGHRFHVKCGDDWLKKLAACPNCKLSLENYRNEEHRDEVKQTSLKSKLFRVKDNLVYKWKYLMVFVIDKVDAFNRKKLV